MAAVHSDQSDPPSPIPGTAPAAVTHSTTIKEKGSFATARCTCGWVSAARRSRDKARKDAAKHEAEQ